MNGFQRYEYHNELFNRWYEKTYLPAVKLFYRNEITSDEFSVIQRKRTKLLANIDAAEKALKPLAENEK